MTPTHPHMHCTDLAGLELHGRVEHGRDLYEGGAGVAGVIGFVHCLGDRHQGVAILGRRRAAWRNLREDAQGLGQDRDLRPAPEGHHPVVSRSPSGGFLLWAK